MEHQSFNVFFGERLRDKNISLERLSELSGISIKHLENLLSGNRGKLPPPPYLRGYFAKLGSILDFDGEAIWKEWKNKGELRSSGALDTLPENRFAKKSVIKYIWGGVVLLLLLAYGVVQFSIIFGTPILSVENPKLDITTSTSEKVTVSGTLTNATELFLNGESVPVEKGGTWEMGVLLQAGLNTIELRAKKFLGRETVVTRQIIYEPPAGLASTTIPIR
ncbi:MAG: helix-turn-helix domain-containing protein [Candidatus Liptonbacteria bacterium]|nr:helix-turn-helix domain-containing protein [Candidatus Liptonbacteria bacterium]